MARVIRGVRTFKESDASLLVMQGYSRPVGEFERYFDVVIPVPAEFYSNNLSRGLRDWLPQVSALDMSTKVIHELIGLLWYRVKSKDV